MAKISEDKLKQVQKRYDKVTRMFGWLYEYSMSGSISNDNFTRLVDKYQAEQAQPLEQIDAPERAMQEIRDTRQNTVQWANLMAGTPVYRNLPPETSISLWNVLRFLTVWRQMTEWSRPFVSVTVSAVT